MTEEQLINGLRMLNSANKRQGEIVFKYIVESYQAIIYNTCIGIVGDSDDAKDIAQDVFIQLYKSSDKFRGDSKISTWLYRIAINKSLNYLRDNKKHKKPMSIQRFYAGDEEREVHIKDNSSSSPEDIAEHSEHKIALRSALNMLPENQKTAFVLKNYDDISYKKIAEIMEISLSSVESLIHRAKKNLQKSLDYYYRNNM